MPAWKLAKLNSKLKGNTVDNWAFAKPLAGKMIEGHVYVKLDDVLKRMDLADAEIRRLNDECLRLGSLSLESVMRDDITMAGLREQLKSCLATIEAQQVDLEKSGLTNRNLSESVQGYDTVNAILRQKVNYLKNRLQQRQSGLSSTASENAMFNEERVKYLEEKLSAMAAESFNVAAKLIAAQNTIKQLQSDKRTCKLSSDNAKLNAAVRDLSTACNDLRRTNSLLREENEKLRGMAKTATEFNLTYSTEFIYGTDEKITNLERRVTALESTIDPMAPGSFFIKGGPRVR
jgi:FtsZ-binding cell division protein ZapB